jgi:hypothetical protein
MADDAPLMHTKPYECRVITRAQDFRPLRNAHVLIYWPHGFGDWVFLSLILGQLDQSNRYYVTRFGDDFISLFDGCDIAKPIYCGADETDCADGAKWDNQHFSKKNDRVLLPLAAHHACTAAGIDTFLTVPFYETYGAARAPAHSKARLMLQSLTNRPPTSPLLQSCLQFEAPPNVKAWVESRLRTWCGFDSGKKLCVIARHGSSSIGKNWGHRWRKPELPEAQECRDFMLLMRQKDPSWMFVTMEEKEFEGDNTIRGSNCYSYCQVFKNAPPLGLALKALLGYSSLCVGVPTGPFHLAMAMPSLPVVGVWIEHWPLWYDEPRGGTIHVLSRFLRETGTDKRIGSVKSCGSVDLQLMTLDTQEVPGQAVFDAAQTLL